MRWTASQILRPVIFALAIVAAVVTGNRTDSFWLGLLAFFIAMASGRALRALVRGDAAKALYRAIWPAAATGFSFLFDGLGLPRWATFFVAFIAASMTRNALGPLLPNQRRWTRRVEWRRIDLDELLP
ncbi:MAG: hypothetical protein QOF43_1772 [Gaiellaceae bacterium]|nr:hypothetical protein [Gaiellaceae bacterium]